jgi:AcrR family transcriptional regulator
MAAHQSIDRDSIIGAALDLVREGGWESVSARSLAARLGASTMPIYSAIGSMEELRKAAFVAAVRRLDAAQRMPRTGNEAIDLAVGYVIFARDEPRLFAFILSNQKDIGDALLAAANDPDAPGSITDIAELRGSLGALSQPQLRDDLILHSWIFANGLATLIAGGTLVMDDSEITRRLRDAGGAFYLYAQHKEERA